MTSTLYNFRQVLKEKNLDGFIVTNPTNIFYLTGFAGALPSDPEREAFLVFGKKATLITARIYQNEASQVKSPNLDVKIARERNEMIPLVLKLLSGTQRVGFEENSLTFGQYQALENALRSGSDPDQGPTLKPYANLVEQMRVIKTAEEIKKIEKAQIISQSAFDQILKTLKIGQTEEEIATHLSQIIKSLGGQKLSFESIIASGPNSGIPHHRTGKRPIKKGGILLLDFGAKYQNYHADLSRTIFIGKAKNEQKNIFHHVKGAQQKAIKQIKSGTKTSQAYHFANNHFKNLKLEEFFLHGLGHGIGLEIHEEPYLRSSVNMELAEGMVFSVEPGLYFPWGGVRIEDLVVIQNGQVRVLGKTQDQIIELK